MNDPSELNFGIQDFPFGWQIADKGEVNGGFQVRALKLGSPIVLPEVIVASWVRVFSDEQNASQSYTRERLSKSERFVLDDPRIGDESFVYYGDATYEISFRFANVFAKVTMYSTYGGSLKGVQEWAKKLGTKIDRMKRVGTGRATSTLPAATETTTIVTESVGTPSPTPVPTSTPLPSNVFVLVGNMALPRVSHSAVRLQDGRVLVAGGFPGIGQCGGAYRSAEVFDPASGTWSQAASMRVGRSNFTMTLLPDGRVVVAGGQDDSGGLASGEVYEPRTN